MTDIDVVSAGRETSKSRAMTGYDASRLNAVRHGVLSRYTVLPWENEAEYEALLGALFEEHGPSGPTEMHLVVELAGVLWRKRRLRLAEIATYRRGLQATTDTYSKTAQSALVASAGPKPSDIDVTAVIESGDIDSQCELAELDADRRMTLAALEILATNRNRAYEDALEVLHDSTREAWSEQLSWMPDDYEESVTPYSPDGASLQKYLNTEIMSWYEGQRAQIIAQPQVRAQALGESLDPDKLERLGRYETHLDRKLERTLSTLIRLQELGRGNGPAGL